MARIVRVALITRAVVWPLVRAGRVGTHMQPTTGWLEQHLVDIDASSGRVDVVWMGELPPDRRLIGSIRLSLCHACKRYHEQSYRNQQDSAPHKRHPFH